MRIILALLLAASLAACSTTGIVTPPDHPRLDAPSAETMRDCALPGKLPSGEMTQAQIEKYWGLDRKHQIDCAKRHGILRDYIIDRDGGLVGKKK